MKIRLFLFSLVMNSTLLYAQYTEQGYAAFFPSEKEGTVFKNGEVYLGTMAVVAHKTFEANTLLRITNLGNNKVTTARVVEQLHPNADAFLMVSTHVGNLLGMSRYCMSQVSIEPYEDEDASTYGVVIDHETAPTDDVGNPIVVAVSEAVTLPSTRRMRSFDELDQSINSTKPTQVKPTNGDYRMVINAKPEALATTATVAAPVVVPQVPATPTTTTSFGQTVQQVRTVVNNVGAVAGQLQQRIPVTASTQTVAQPATTPTNQPGYAPVYIPQSSIPVQPQTPLVAPTTTAPVQTNLNFKWTVQVGVFSTPQAANQQMATVGQGAWYQEAQLNGRLVYRVNYGRFIDRAAADTAKNQLQQRGIVGLSKEIQ